jgi:hypothetical protein
MNDFKLAVGHRFDLRGDWGGPSVWEYTRVNLAACPADRELARI